MMKHITKSKNDILPLQGKCLWGTWASHNKERYCHKLKQPSHDVSVAEYMQLIDEKKLQYDSYNFTANFQNSLKNF